LAGISTKKGYALKLTNRNYLASFVLFTLLRLMFEDKCIRVTFFNKSKVNTNYYNL